MPTKTPIKDRVDAVKQHALDTYDKGGDVVIETMTDWEIADIIEGSKSNKGAIWKMSVHTGPYLEQRRTVRAEIF